jgi:hypothetical protein
VNKMSDLKYQTVAGMKKHFKHETRKGPGRITTDIPKPGKPGSKLARAAHNGVCGLRHGVGPAGRLALEGKLGKK